MNLSRIHRKSHSNDSVSVSFCCFIGLLVVIAGILLLPAMPFIVLYALATKTKIRLGRLIHTLKQLPGTLGAQGKRLSRLGGHLDRRRFRQFLENIELPPIREDLAFQRNLEDAECRSLAHSYFSVIRWLRREQRYRGYNAYGEIARQGISIIGANAASLICAVMEDVPPAAWSPAAREATYWIMVHHHYTRQMALIMPIDELQETGWFQEVEDQITSEYID